MADYHFLMFFPISLILTNLLPFTAGEDGPNAEPAVPRLRRARCRFPLWSVHVRGLQELLWEDVQQPVGDPGVQEQLQMRRGQEEQDRVQGVQAEEVPHGRHVQVRLQVWEEVQLVQDPLPHAEPAVESLSTSQPVAKPAPASHLDPFNILATSSRRTSTPSSLTARQRWSSL